MTCLFGKLKFLCTIVAFTLLAVSFQPAYAEGESRILATYNRVPKTAAPHTAPQQQADPKVLAAGFQTPSMAREDLPAENHRLLAPPTRREIAKPTGSGAATSSRTPAFAMPKIESFATAGSGLAIVVGLFLVCVWLLRRNGPKPTSPLPKEVVSVLGRVPLAARNFAHLLQFGNKLVLVAVTPDGVSPIAEVTDPAEVDRLLGLCLRNHKQSTTAEFHHILEKLSQEPANGFLGNEVATSYTSQK